MANTTAMDYGELEVTDGRAMLKFTRRLDHSPDRVWAALTEPDQLAAWFPSTLEGERRAGAALTFRFEHVDGIDPMHGEMVAFDPPALLELTWGGDRLRFELQPDGDGTTLTFTVWLDELGKAVRDGSGWHQCLDSLDAVLSGTAARPDDSGRWRELRDAYAEKFPPEAAVLGPPKEWEEKNGEA
jgi:uncharacterized protein YndB with AHSA1/START domain